MVARVKVNLITRSSAALAILLVVAASLGLSAPAAAGAQAPHAGAQSPPETKIGASAHIEPLRSGYEFPHGQTLHYEGEWRFLPAGVATVRMERAGSQEHVTATADSIGVVALLYRVQDQFNSYFDAKSLCSYKLLKHTEEGLHRRETVISYDYARGKAILEERNLKDNQQKKTENDIPSCVTDVLSGIFYVGSLPLQPGANYRFPLNNGGKTVTVQAHVEGKEQIKTPAGTFQTIRVGPEGDSGILSGRIWIWYTDDARHLPVQMRAKLFWGMLTIYLTSIGK
ncbi:MAG: DUF3108 domain-containing protein [Candidatus Korobacteraceae bacterium]